MSFAGVHLAAECATAPRIAAPGLHQRVQASTRISPGQ